MKALVFSICCVALQTQSCPPPPTVPDASPPQDAADDFSPPPPPPPVQDSAPPLVVDAAPIKDSAPDVQLDACGSYCIHLATVGCSEGAAVNCIDVCRHLLDAGTGILNPQIPCVTKATSKTGVRACGSIVCK